MIDEGLRKAVETLALGELQRANKIHSQFVDMHHGYSVIKEEIEECQEALELIESAHECLWNCARTDNSKTFKSEAETIKRYAIELALEAIQVAAVAQKCINIVDVHL